MARFDLTDLEWSVIQPLLPNKPRGAGVKLASARIGMRANESTA